MTVAELNQSLEAERALGASLNDYAGLWVGISDQEVIASAATLEALVEQTESQGIEDFEVLFVPENPNAACFY
jgi:hypothetical protein